MADEPSSWITIGSPRLSARIDPMGAQLSVLQDAAGRDLLWNGDAAYWAGRAPVLFPIIGTLAGGRYRLGERSYALSRHGFARGARFDVLQATATAASFRLGASDHTRAVYPFEFELDLSFEVDAATLTVTAVVRNLSDTDMPASVGFHPGFRWPLPYGQLRAQHDLQFAHAEPAPVRRITPEGLLSPASQPTPVIGRRLVLDDALFQPDVVIFERLASRSLTYGATSGPRLEIGFPDSTWLGVWTKPGAPFICIEPWQGVTDPEGFAADFRDKPGVFLVAPGRSHSQRMTIALHDA